MLIINKVKRHTVVYQSENPHILALSGDIHVKVCNILQLFFPFLLHAHIFRNDNPYIILLLIKILRERSHNICKASGLNKRNTF